jgi:hypothetical protein
MTEISPITIKGVERKRVVRTICEFHNFKQSRILNGDLIEDESSVESQYESITYQDRLIEGETVRDYEQIKTHEYKCNATAKIVVIPNEQSPIGVELYFILNQEKYEERFGENVVNMHPLEIFPSEKEFVETLRDHSKIVIGKGIEGVEQEIPVPLSQSQIKSIFITNLDERGFFNIE